MCEVFFKEQIWCQNPEDLNVQGNIWHDDNINFKLCFNCHKSFRLWLLLKPLELVLLPWKKFQFRFASCRDRNMFFRWNETEGEYISRITKFLMGLWGYLRVLRQQDFSIFSGISWSINQWKMTCLQFWLKSCFCYMFQWREIPLSWIHVST